MTPTSPFSPPPTFHHSQVSITPTTENYSSSIQTDADSADDFPEPIHTLYHGGASTLKVPHHTFLHKRQSNGVYSTISIDEKSPVLGVRAAPRDATRDASIRGSQSLKKRIRSASDSSVKPSHKTHAIFSGQMRVDQRNSRQIDVTPDSAPSRTVLEKNTLNHPAFGVHCHFSNSDEKRDNSAMEQCTMPSGGGSDLLPKQSSLGSKQTSHVHIPQAAISPISTSTTPSNRQCTESDAIQGAFGVEENPRKSHTTSTSSTQLHSLQKITKPPSEKHIIPSNYSSHRPIPRISTNRASSISHSKMPIENDKKLTGNSKNNTTRSTPHQKASHRSTSSDDDENQELQSINDDDAQQIVVEMDPEESDSAVSNQQEATEQILRRKFGHQANATRHSRRVSSSGGSGDESHTKRVPTEEVLLVEEQRTPDISAMSPLQANSQALSPLTMEHVTPYTASTEHHSSHNTFPAQQSGGKRGVTFARDPQQMVHVVNESNRPVEVRRVTYAEDDNVGPVSAHESQPHPEDASSVERYAAALSSDTEAIIRLENVQKTYLLGIEGVPALRGVSLEIMRGEFVIVYGTSGGGKTSLLNIIGTIDKATKGRIQIGNSQVREQTKDSQLANIRLKKIGFVFQTFNLLGTMTALENVEMPMILRGKLSRSARRKRAKELLKQVGMGERMHHRPAQMSGGEQQRVTIARAIANEPEIMILDEPTGDLDTHNTRMVMNLLQRLNRDQKITMVMVTHDPGLKNASDRVIRMRDGKVAGVEVVSVEARNRFWTDLRQRMPTHVADDDHGEVRRDSLRKNTEIREPRNYAQFRGCLQEAQSMAEEMLQDCISRSRPGYGGTSSRMSTTTSRSTRTPTSGIPPSATSTTLSRRSRRTVYEDDTPQTPAQFPVQVLREVPASGGGDHVSIRIDDA
uniref:ABC transporter domain-containing protein n=1 Tax=Percolomonas cosmopolitus TaxID=63605 RepID=A0A7S1KLG9_9EUKA|eukprot:CAMPEP_0117444258 /NCGR_PEP_ID=MMETSP0759-20121206/5142_1 /TAXON_ID=63605 /ORGANISM="Percolomonas cosmopolitus, Strain WS" /LENGTH=914 /DNA_ID=CAMNT_0005236307 /DNA_START=13 /DNA_END=2757 /DNA_ORIENTATION=-